MQVGKEALNTLWSTLGMSSEEEDEINHTDADEDVDSSRGVNITDKQRPSDVATGHTGDKPDLSPEGPGEQSLLPGTMLPGGKASSGSLQYRAPSGEAQRVVTADHGFGSFTKTDSAKPQAAQLPLRGQHQLQAKPVNGDSATMDPRQQWLQHRQQQMQEQQEQEDADKKAARQKGVDFLKGDTLKGASCNPADFYKTRTARLERRTALHRGEHGQPSAAEQSQELGVTRAGGAVGGGPWDRVCALVDLKLQVTAGERDISRMKAVMLRARNIQQRPA